MRTQGKITKWKDDKGFGFIAPNDGGPEIFLHEDSLLKRSRRPVTSDIVTFEAVSTPDGKVGAKRVLFQGEIDPRKIAVMVDIFLVTLALFFTVATGGLVYFSLLPLSILYIYLLASFITFAIYSLDKSAAKSDKWRTSEKSLHILSLIGGWPGALIAQRLLSHKSRKRSFQKIYWGTVIINIILLVLLFHPVGKVFLNKSLPAYSMKYQKIIEDKINYIIDTQKTKSEANAAGKYKFKGAIYSWTNKEGKKIFSNVGFPKDQTYTDGKIEWH